MELIKNEQTSTYHEIEVTKKFLFWKWNVKYRKVNNDILRYVEPNNYSSIGFIEHMELSPLFYVKL